MSDSSFVERLASTIQTNANARQIFGDPVERDGVTVIPVARVSWSFGGGGVGQGPGERSGGGGGARVTSIGYIEVRQGSSEFKPIHDPADMSMLILAGLGGLLAGVILAKLV